LRLCGFGLFGFRFDHLGLDFPGLYQLGPGHLDVFKPRGGVLVGRFQPWPGLEALDGRCPILFEPTVRSARQGGGLTPLLALVAWLWIPLIVLAQQPDSVELLETDSRSPYVHRITLYDHYGKAISPDDAPALPYSPRTTCGKCHPYATISHGWHFNPGGTGVSPVSWGGGELGRRGEDYPNVAAGRPGEPWFLIDEKTGTVIPVSGRGWPGTFKPADVGLSDWDMINRFGRHMPGGGFGEPSDEAGRASASTPLPLREGLGEGGSPAARWQVSGPLEIDCMFCHSADQQHDPAEAARQIEKENFRWAATAALGLGVVRGEARKAPDDWDPYTPPNPDFPEQAGPTLIYDRTRFDPDDRVLFQITRRVPNERCYFCHTTRIVGDDAPETWHTDQDVHLAAGLLCVDCHRHGIDHAMTRGSEGESEHPARASRTCRGCHLGNENSTGITTALGGHLRAPHPDHEGLPPLHLKELTCTACHSGPWPRQQVQRIQTSLAHQLGLPTRERGADTAPAIVGPVFARRDDEPIAPFRQVNDGKLIESYRWPLAHDVRPAAQSLGAGGCEDCHGWRTPIFWGQVSLAGDGPMWKLHRYSPVLADVWAIGFRTRPAFKWFGLACAALVALVMLRGVVGSVPWTPPSAVAVLRRPALIVMLVGAGIQAVTGLGGEWLCDEVGGWTLLLHMLGAPWFILGLTGVAVLWPAVYAGGTISVWRKLALWAVIVAGFVVMTTMLAAMLPVFGYAAQETLTEVHGTSAWLLLIALVAWGLAGRRARVRAASASERSTGGTPVPPGM
jgi:hypothetical protein